jgi:hypothetical protein
VEVEFEGVASLQSLVKHRETATAMVEAEKAEAVWMGEVLRLHLRAKRQSEVRERRQEERKVEK